MKRIVLLCFAAVLAFVLGGCLGAASLDTLGYVSAIGFDKGERQPYAVTMLILNTNMESDDQQSGGTTAVSTECGGLYEAIGVLSASLPYKLDLSRTMLIVLSAEVARDGAAALLGAPYGQLRMRDNINLFVSTGSAEDALKGMENDIVPNLHKMAADFAGFADETGLSVAVTRKDWLEALSGGRFDAVLPVCGAKPEKHLPVPAVLSDGAYMGGYMAGSGGMKTSLSGAAVFSGDRLVCLLDGQHAMTLNMVQGTFRTGRVQAEVNGERMDVLLRRGGAPRIALTASAAPTVTVEVPLTLVPERQDGDPLALCSALEATLTERAEKTFRFCRAFSADAFGFGRYAAKQFLYAPAWQAYGWRTRFPALTATFRFTVTPVKEGAD